MIQLPFPPAALSGHNTGHWRAKSGIVAKHREWARRATLAAKPNVPTEGDIRVCVTFYPPNKRGDRVNFPNRCKPYFDGIADALKVNDSRFIPAYQFGEPIKGGAVIVVVGAWGLYNALQPCDRCRTPVPVHAVSPSECFCSAECAQ